MATQLFNFCKHETTGMFDARPAHNVNSAAYSTTYIPVAIVVNNNNSENTL